jgi:hypothetical protein
LLLIINASRKGGKSGDIDDNIDSQTYITHVTLSGQMEGNKGQIIQYSDNQLSGESLNKSYLCRRNKK